MNKDSMIQKKRRMTQNDIEWLKAQNDSKWLRMTQNDLGWLKIKLE